MYCLKSVFLWFLSVFFFSGIFMFFPSLSSVFCILTLALVLPVAAWQAILKKFIPKKLKRILAIIFAILAIATAPATEVEAPDESGATDASTAITTTEAIEASTKETEKPHLVEISEATTEAAHTEATSEVTVETVAEVSAEAATTAETTVSTTVTTTAETTASTTASTTAPQHTHKFSFATCTSPATCSCGATNGSENGHNWSDATYSSPKKCTVCGQTTGQSVEKPGKENYHGHVYTGGDKSVKFHYEADCAGKKSHEITWEDVDRFHLGPCKTCVLN